jgi:putative restriction endonuclease
MEGAVTETGWIFGDVPGNPEGTTYSDRRSLSEAGVHAPLEAGIWGRQAEGVASIVLNGGYEDDVDNGDEIVYTGHGGQARGGRHQIADQELALANLALARNVTDGLPVRVIRGPRGDPRHSPKVGFRYDGLFRVDRYWHAAGKSGFRVYRYELTKAAANPVAGATPPETPSPGPRPEGSAVTRRVATTTQRVVRNTAVTQWVKEEHRYACQICGIVLTTPAGPYAEGAHIRPIGGEHRGADEPGNVLCLCPNHHTLFDFGAVAVADDLTVADTVSRAPLGRLRTTLRHQIDPIQLRYHREHVAKAT